MDVILKAQYVIFTIRGHKTINQKAELGDCKGVYNDGVD